jgi:NAD(P)-dependent dehydrogenase (short-subunit alcohol dehydrogenase family)
VKLGMWRCWCWAMGCQSRVPLEDMSIETMEHILDTNLTGNIHSIKAALPFIKSSKSAPASIAIFSSQAGQVCALFLTQRARWVRDLKTCSQVCII